VLVGDLRLYTDRWWEVKQEQEQAAAERSAREKKEQEAMALENYHGPRWWEKERTRYSLNVRFTPKSGHRQSALGCPLCAKS
jgi:hypothetical protein